MDPQKLANIIRWAELTGRRCPPDADFETWLIEEWMADGAWAPTEFNARLHARVTTVAN